MNKDFLIISWEWHDGLPSARREKGHQVGLVGLGLLLQNHLSFSFDALCIRFSLPIFVIESFFNLRHSF